MCCSAVCRSSSPDEDTLSSTDTCTHHISHITPAHITPAHITHHTCTYHTSHITHHTAHLHTSHITQHTSHSTHHTAHLHTSHITPAHITHHTCTHHTSHLHTSHSTPAHITVYCIDNSCNMQELETAGIPLCRRSCLHCWLAGSRLRGQKENTSRQAVWSPQHMPTNSARTLPNDPQTGACAPLPRSPAPDSPSR